MKRNCLLAKTKPQPTVVSNGLKTYFLGNTQELIPKLMAKMMYIGDKFSCNQTTLYEVANTNYSDVDVSIRDHSQVNEVNYPIIISNAQGHQSIKRSSY